MADKPIKLTDAQLTTLQQVADPNYKKHGIPQTLIHEDIGHYNFGTLKSLQKRGLVVIAELYSHILGECIPDTVHLTDKGREFLGIAPIPLAPPPKTDKERIAELEAAIRVVLLNLPTTEPNRMEARNYPIAYNAYTAHQILTKALGEE